jgi:hypothetical protein
MKKMLMVALLVPSLLAAGCGGDTGESLVAGFLVIGLAAGLTAAWNVTEPWVEIAGDAASSAWVHSVEWINETTGQIGHALGTNFWTAIVPLMLGANTITFTAHDSDGRIQRTTVTVTYQP